VTLVKNNYVLIIVVAIFVGIVAFFGGVKYQESKTNSGDFARRFQNGTWNRTGGQNVQGRFGGSRPVAGEILNVDDKSMTVKLQDGSSRIVLLSDKTSITKVSQASKSDLKVGERVLAIGTENSDGSVSVVNIQLNPMFSNQLSPIPK